MDFRGRLAAAVSILILGAAASPASAQWAPAGAGNYGLAGQVPTSAASGASRSGQTYILSIPAAYPAWPASSSTGVSHPNVWPAASGALYLPGGFMGEAVPANLFFNDSDYGVNCDNTLMHSGAYTQFEGIGGGWVSVPATYDCKMTKAPVVDMDWVHKNLDAGGYTYWIAYPVVDNGNGRALISWVKGCWLDATAEDVNNGKPYMCFNGMARLEGAGFVQEFAPDTYCEGFTTASYSRENLGQPPVCAAWATRPYGAASEIASWPAPYNKNGTMIMRWMAGAGNEIVQTYDAINPFLQAIEDDWLGAPPAPPPLPPLPPVVAGIPADPLNTAAMGVNTNNGGTAVNTAGGQNQVPFNYVAFCNKPASDGGPRSAQFVANCLASLQQ